MAALFPPFTPSDGESEGRERERGRGRGEVVLHVFKWAAKTGDADGETSELKRQNGCEQTSTREKLCKEPPYLTPSTVAPFHSDTHTYTHTGLSSSSIEEQSGGLASSGSSCLSLNEGRHSLVSQGAGCLPVPRPLSAILLRTKWSPYERSPALSLHRSH